MEFSFDADLVGLADLAAYLEEEEGHTPEGLCTLPGLEQLQREVLDAKQKCYLVLLSMFPGSFELQDAWQLLDLPLDQARQFLGLLQSVQLVQYDVVSEQFALKPAGKQLVEEADFVHLQEAICARKAFMLHMITVLSCCLHAYRTPAFMPAFHRLKNQRPNVLKLWELLQGPDVPDECMQALSTAASMDMESMLHQAGFLADTAAPWESLQQRAFTGTVEQHANMLMLAATRRSESAADLVQLAELQQTLLQQLGPHNITHINSMVALSMELVQLKQWEAAEVWCRAALEQASGLVPDHPLYVRCAVNLGFCLVMSGNPTAAEPTCSYATHQLMSTLGPEHPDTLSSLVNLATCQAGKGDPEAAYNALMKVFRTRCKILGTDHPTTSNGLAYAGICLKAMAEYDSADATFRQALMRKPGQLPVDSRDASEFMHHIGDCLQHQGQPELAQHMYREALTASRDALGPLHPATLTHMSCLAHTLLVGGKHAAAEPVLREAVVVSERINGRQHPHTIHTIHNFAACLVCLSQCTAAAPLCQEVWQWMVDNRGHGHQQTLDAAKNLAWCLQSMGKFQPAADQYGYVHSHLCHLKGSRHPDAVACAELRADCLFKLGQFQEASSLLQDVLNHIWEAGNDESGGTRVLQVMLSLAECKQKLQQHPQVDHILAMAVEAGQRNLGPEHPLCIRCMQKQASCLLQTGNFKAAEDVLHELVDLLEAVAGPRHRRTLNTLVSLGVCQAVAGQFEEAAHTYETVLPNLHQGCLPEWDRAEQMETLGVMKRVATHLISHGHHAASECILRTILRVREQVQGPVHPDAMKAFGDVCAVMLIMGKDKESQELLRHVGSCIAIDESLPASSAEIHEAA